MSDQMPSRGELRRRVFGGVSHDELRRELESRENHQALLRRLASVPSRAPLWWESVIGAWLLLFWSVYIVVYSLGTAFGHPSASGLFAWGIAVLFAVQIWIRNGAAYGAAAVWLAVSIVVEWRGYLSSAAAANGDVAQIRIEATVVTVLMTLTVAALLVLQRRLFPHVTFFGRHRASDERRVVQF